MAFSNLTTVQGFRPVNKTEGRIYWSRPDVARAHGKTSWPSRGPPRGGSGAAVEEAGAPGAQETAASNPRAQRAMAEAPAINACETLTAHMTFHGPVRACVSMGCMSSCAENMHSTSGRSDEVHGWHAQTLDAQPSVAACALLQHRQQQHWVMMPKGNGE